jgi:hypothetical protein
MLVLGESMGGYIEWRLWVDLREVAYCSKLSHRSFEQHVHLAGVLTLRAVGPHRD